MRYEKIQYLVKRGTETVRARPSAASAENASRHVTSHEIRLSNTKTRMQIVRFWPHRTSFAFGLLAMGHHHSDLSAEILFVEMNAVHPRSRG